MCNILVRCARAQMAYYLLQPMMLSDLENYETQMDVGLYFGRQMQTKEKQLFRYHNSKANKKNAHNLMKDDILFSPGHLKQCTS